VKHINWDTGKSLKLKESRGICFEDIIFYIEKGDILDDYLHPNQKRYPEQRIMVIGINDYAYLVPYVEDAEEIFLKTIIPSRKATDIYFGGIK
jgi:hypothetical protein